MTCCIFTTEPAAALNLNGTFRWRLPKPFPKNLLSHSRRVAGSACDDVVDGVSALPRRNALPVP
jgi:hypothetical protein